MTKEEYLELRDKIKEFETNNQLEFQKAIPEKSVVKKGGVLLLTGCTNFDSKKVESIMYATKLNIDGSTTLNGKNFIKIDSSNIDQIVVKDKDYIYNLLVFIEDKISKIDSNLPHKEYENKILFWNKLKNRVYGACPHDFDNYGNCRFCSQMKEEYPQR